MLRQSNSYATFYVFNLIDFFIVRLWSCYASLHHSSPALKTRQPSTGRGIESIGWASILPGLHVDAAVLYQEAIMASVSFGEKKILVCRPFRARIRHWRQPYDPASGICHTELRSNDPNGPCGSFAT